MPEDAPFDLDEALDQHGKAAAAKTAAKPKAKPEAPAEPERPMLKQELADLIETDPAKALVSEETRSELYAEIESAIAAFEPDLSTGVGRKAIASLAYKITRTKTALDEAGKELNAELRKRIDAVDVVRREARAKLDELAEKARQPLTDWENDEKRRLEIKREILDKIAALVAGVTNRSDDVGSAGIEAILEQVKAIAIDPDIFLDDTEAGDTARDDAISTLAYALVQAQEREEQAAELERLRAAQAEREAELARLRAAEEQRKREEDQRRIDRERADREAREAAEQAEREKEAAIERARAEERQRAEAEREAAELAHRQEIERLERERVEKEAEAERARQETAAREADVAHKRRINTAARDALIGAGATKELAQAIVASIARGEIPHIVITY